MVIIGLAFVSFWTYQRYFQEEGSNFLLFEVERGSIQEVVKVRGEVVTRKDVDLTFPFIGTVLRIYVSEGDKVAAGRKLIELDTSELLIDKKDAQAQLDLRKAELDELLAKPTIISDAVSLKVEKKFVAVQNYAESGTKKALG